MKISHIFLYTIAATLAPQSHANRIGYNPEIELSINKNTIKQEVEGLAQDAWLRYFTRSQAARALDQQTADQILREHGTPEQCKYAYSREAVSIHNKPDQWFMTTAANTTALAIISYQTPSGGWAKNIDYSAGPRNTKQSFTPNATTDEKHQTVDSLIHPTLDNGATTQELLFLLKYHSLNCSYSKEMERCIIDGISYLLEAQMPNGGWPQTWPLRGGYSDAITLNDKSYIRIMGLLTQLSTRKDSFIPPTLKAEAEQATKRGLTCLLSMQVRAADGTRLGWCQQYSPLRLTPAPGRAFEMAALGSIETADVVKFLKTLSANEEDLLNAISSARAWLEKVSIKGLTYKEIAGDRILIADAEASPLWARFYSIQTNTPLFGDRDRSIYDTIGDISHERRNGYRWYTTSPKSVLDSKN